MWKTQLTLLITIIGCISMGLAIHKCSDPTPYYNKYINSQRAIQCPEGNTAQCVAAVFQLCGAPATSSWRKGLKVNTNCQNIPKNTAIASFSGSGGTKYDGKKGHAAVFLSCLPGGSIRVADQWCGQKFSERILSKGCSSYSNCADYFYTIEW